MIEPERLIDYFQRACAEILDRGTIDTLRVHQLRPGQTQGYQSFSAYLERKDLEPAEKLEGFFTMSVGLGKTGFFGALIDRVFNYARQDGYDPRAMIVAPRVDLLYQAKDDFEIYFPSLVEQIGVYGGNWPDTPRLRREADKSITNITFPSWSLLIERGRMWDVDILITDEGHRGTSPKRERLIKARFPNAAKYAFQATPDFSEIKSVRNTHGREIFSKRLMASIVENESTAYARAQHHIIRVIPKPEEDIKVAKQAAFAQFVNAMFKTGISQSTGEAYGFDEVTGERLTDNQLGIYTGSTAQADYVAKVLNDDNYFQEISHAQGRRAFAVSIHTVGIEHRRQKSMKDDYERGRFTALVGDELFKEGYNYPPMKTVVVAPTGSALDLEQILGRAARKWWNVPKERYEGMTAISTTIYIGVEPDNPRDPASIDLARLKDSKARDAALASTVSAVDVLGESQVLGPGINPETRRRERNPPGPPPPFDSVQFESYTSIDSVMTVHMEQQRLRIVNREIYIQDWPRSEEYEKIQELRETKGNVSARILFETAKRERATTPGVLDTFPSSNVIDNIISGRRDAVTVSELSVLTHLLNLCDNAIGNWRQSPELKELRRLRHQKGNIGAVEIFNLAQRDVDTKDVFTSWSVIANVINGTVQIVPQRYLDTISKVLEGQPNVITNWPRSREWRKFSTLRRRKGQVGATIIYRISKNHASTRDIFKSEAELNFIIIGQTQKVTEEQYKALLSLYAKLPDMILDWPHSKQYEALTNLRKKKGNPAGLVIYNLAGADPELREHLPSIAVAENLATGLSETVPVKRAQAAIRVVSKMPDVIADWNKSPEFAELSELRQSAGNLGATNLYKLIEKDQVAANLFTSSGMLGYFLTGQKESITVPQARALLRIVRRYVRTQEMIRNKNAGKDEVLKRPAREPSEPGASVDPRAKSPPVPDV